MRAVYLLLLVGILAAGAPEKQVLTDDLLYDRVIRKLANDPDLKTTALEVRVRDRAVTLRGLVDTNKLRQRAERVVRKVSGVKTVINQLLVRP